MKPEPFESPALAALYLLSAITLAGLSSCTPLDINVGTEKPLDVDMSVNIHVYQFGPDDEDGSTGAKPANEPEAIELSDFNEALARIENREGEIWKLKGPRLVGESHKGLLSIRNENPSAWGEYSKELVDAENKDREIIMKYEAARQGKKVEEIRRMEWQKWRLKANGGEWIEEEDKETGEFRWTRKNESSPESGQD